MNITANWYQFSHVSSSYLQVNISTPKAGQPNTILYAIPSTWHSVHHYYYLINLVVHQSVHPYGLRTSRTGTQTTYTIPLAPVDTSELHQKSALMQQRRLRHLLDQLNTTGLRKPPSERARKVHPKVLSPLHADRLDQPSRLLRLPVEIRTIIWTPMMMTETGKLHYNAGKTDSSSSVHTNPGDGRFLVVDDLSLGRSQCALAISQVFPWPADEMQFAI